MVHLWIGLYNCACVVESGMPVTIAKRYLIFVTYAGFMIVGSTAGALNIAWLHIEDEFGLTLSSLGLLLTLPAVGRLAISFFSGRIVMKMGTGLFLIMGGALMFVGLGGFVAAPTWALLVIAAIVLRMGNSILLNGLNIFVASNYKSSNMNWLHAFFGMGLTVGPILMTFVTVNLARSWRIGYAVIFASVAALLLVFVLTRSMWQLPTDELARAARKNTKKSVVQDAQERPVNPLSSTVIMYLGIVLMFITAGMEATTGQLSNSLLVDGRGLDPAIVGRWISLYWFSFTIGRVLTGFIIDKVDHGMYLRLNLAGTIIGAGLIWWNPGVIWNFVGLLVMGFSLAPFAPTIMGDTPARVGAERAPNVLGYQNTGAGLGIALIPSLAGILGDRMGLETLGVLLITLAAIGFVVHEFLLIYEQKTQTSDLTQQVS